MDSRLVGHEVPHRPFRVRQGGTQPPGHQVGVPLPQVGQGQLQLRAPLAGQQLVPLVDDHSIEPPEKHSGVGIGQ